MYKFNLKIFFKKIQNPHTSDHKKRFLWNNTDSLLLDLMAFSNVFYFNLWDDQSEKKIFNFILLVGIIAMSDTCILIQLLYYVFHVKEIKW